MGLLDKFKDKVNKSSSSSSADTADPPLPTARPLDSNDIFRYRKQHGVNLGSWFVLEPWISSSVFRNAVAPGRSDMDVARGTDAKAVLEQHWDSWIQDEDWAWIKERGFNSVRIPVSDICHSGSRS